jgi:hypothetical protein
MQYLWTAWRPEYQNVLLEGHAGLYYSGGLNYKYDIHQPQARDDNYLILVGLLALVEAYETLQWVLGCAILVYVGRRALSEFPHSHYLRCGSWISFELRANFQYRLVPRAKYTSVHSWHQTLASLDRDSRIFSSGCQFHLPRSSLSSN